MAQTADFDNSWLFLSFAVIYCPLSKSTMSMSFEELFINTEGLTICCPKRVNTRPSLKTISMRNYSFIPNEFVFPWNTYSYSDDRFSSSNFIFYSFTCSSISLTMHQVYISKNWIVGGYQRKPMTHRDSFQYSIHCDDVIMGAKASQITSLTIVYSTVYSDADQRKHQSSASLAFVRGIHQGLVNSPHKWPVTRKIFHLMTSSWYVGDKYFASVVFQSLRHPRFKALHTLM